MNEWPLWEVFIRSQHGLAHKHVGSLRAEQKWRSRMHATSIRAAQRRRQHLGGAVLDIVASSPATRTDVRAGGIEDLSASDVFSDARRSQAHLNMNDQRTLFEYLLRLADSDLVLAQRLGEWVGHGPVLEEDIATTNVGLDLLGQSRLWFAYAGEVERVSTTGRTKRGPARVPAQRRRIRNLMLAEQPNGDYAMTTARQFYSTSRSSRLRGLTAAADARSPKSPPRR
jgi:1,2-phenylacetyl-CoA epoxidase PaaB subunit